MSDDSEEAVYNKAAELLDGEDFSWIKIIHETGFLTVLQLLALVLHVLRNGDQTRDRKKGFAGWTNKIMDDVHGGQIVLVDHHSHLTTQIPVPEGSYPALSIQEADFLFEEGHLGSSCSELVKKLFKEKFPQEVEEPASSNKQNKEESKEMAVLRNEVKNLKMEIKNLKRIQDSAAEIITGFAIKHYPQFDPLATKNMALSEMLASLESAGFPQDRKTFDQFLDVGAEKIRRKSQKT